MRPDKLNIALASTFPPTQCGIATYSSDLLTAITKQYPYLKIEKINLLTSHFGSNEQIFSVDGSNPADCARIAESINSGNFDILDLQHEYKIYGKPDGDNLRIILDQIKIPVVSTLHTVFAKLNSAREETFSKLINRSNCIFVFSGSARQFIIEKYRKEPSSVMVVPHGVPDVRYLSPQDVNLRSKFKASVLFVSAGHLRNSKGYENAIKALASLKTSGFDFHYIILGANHPEYDAAEVYRNELKQLVVSLSLSRNVTFIDKYLSREELINYFQAADVFLLPYLRPEQSSSGILSLMIACGRPIVSTPFQFATTCITTMSGELSTFFDRVTFLTALQLLLSRQNDWENIRKFNYEVGRAWSWSMVAIKYYNAYRKVLSQLNSS